MPMLRRFITAALLAFSFLAGATATPALAAAPAPSTTETMVISEDAQDLVIVVVVITEFPDGSVLIEIYVIEVTFTAA